VSRRLARLALGAYPLAFRRRYGAEMRALIDESPPSALGVLDLLRGALGAHVHPPAGLCAALEPGERVRASASAVLACWVAFAAAGFGYYKTTEDGPATVAGSAHPLLGDAHLLIQVLAIAGSLALLAGALPLVAAALAQARRQPRVRRLVSIPPLAVLCFAALTGLLVLFARAQHGPASTVAQGAFVAWLLCGLVCGGVCAVFARRALFALGVKRASLAISLIGATAVTCAMTAMAVATGSYAIALALDAPQVAGAANGPFGASSIGAALLAQTLVMTAAAALAWVSVRRGWRAGRPLSQIHGS
jgi:hypothetical protein